jgi:hypothetical protein
MEASKKKRTERGICMIKKTDVVKAHYKSGNKKEALRLAKGFRLGVTADDRDKMTRAYECMVHPEFYVMLGKNPEAEIEKGLAVFEEKILKAEAV